MEATRFLNDYANQARNEVCGEPQKVFIVFDSKLGRKASRYFKASKTEQKRIKEELNDRGAVFFYGDDTDEKFDSVLTAYKKAMQFLNENELYTCFPEDDRVEKFDDVKSLIKNIKNKTEKKKKESKKKQDKEESPDSDEQA